MNVFSRLSLKSKLVYMLLGVALGCIVVVGYQGLTHGKQEITQKVYDQLTSVRTIQSEQIEAYFELIRAELKSLAENHTTVGAMREFESAFSRFRDETISDAMSDSLRTYYSSEFFPDLKKNIDGEPDLDFYLPHSAAGRYLQYQYISGSPYPRGEKRLLDKAPDQSYYSGVHHYYHPVFRSQVQNSGYYDLFLISLKTGDIVYSVEKETDFATSLNIGPYANSNLANLYRKVKSAQDKGDVQIEDFAFYRPSYGQPAGFLGTVIYDNNVPIGVLAIQIPLGSSVNEQSSTAVSNSLGKTGEVIIAGKDGLMRTNARSLKETVNCYRNTDKSGDINKVTERICRTFSSVLLQEVDNAAVRKAHLGESGTAIVRSYYGEKTLVSYGPLKIDGVDWVMLAGMEVDEANQPVYAFQRDLTLATVLLGCVVTFLAMWLSNVFTRPVNQLMAGVKRLEAGDLDVHIDLNRTDEFGQLADTFNKTASMLRQQKSTILEKERENNALLRNIVPEAVATRLQRGDAEIADRIDNVSVMFASIKGFTRYVEALTPKESVRALNELITAYDQAADKHCVEKVKTIGDSYVACSGLTIPRIDHSKRLVSFARELAAIIEQFNRTHNTDLAIRIGIHSGPVTAGMIGQTRSTYDLWGESVNIASRIRFEAPANAIMITDTVYDRLSNHDGFVHHHQVETIGFGAISVWQWKTDEADISQQDTQIIDRSSLKGVLADE